MLPWQHFCQGALEQKFQFFVKNGLFLLQNVFISDFLARTRNQSLRIDSYAKFHLHWTKDKGTQILTWNNTKHGLMTSYLPPGDDVRKILWLLRDFVPEYHHAKFGCNGSQMKEKQGGRGGGTPACMVPKDPSLNRVNECEKAKSLRPYRRIFMEVNLPQHVDEIGDSWLRIHL